MTSFSPGAVGDSFQNELVQALLEIAFDVGVAVDELPGCRSYR